ncbi:MAG TPA: nuclear transport factor 2 family protein [Steroidobacteraceae bacterium]
MNHAATIEAYYAAWIADDLEAVMRLCTDDVTAVNVPIGPIHGKAAVRDFFTRFGKGITDKRYEVHRVLVSGDAAAIEGVENYVKHGKQVSVPYMSTFLFRGGLIAEWRDYFDLQTVLKQLDLPLDGSKPARAQPAG